MRRRIEDTQEAVKRILGHYDALANHYNRFAALKLQPAQLGNYNTLVFPTPKRKANQTDRSYQDAVYRNDELRKASAGLFEKGVGHDKTPIRGSLWAAYNGVTQLVDYHLTYRNRWQRLDSIWFGDGQRIKQRAFDVALGMANAKN